MEEEIKTGELDATTNETHRNKTEEKFAKLLAQKNQARNEASDYKSIAEKATQEAEEAKRLAVEMSERAERTEFIVTHPEAKDHITNVMEIKNKYNMTTEEAYRFHLANTSPELLADQQFRNKMQSNNNLTGVASTEVKVSVDNITNEEYLKLPWQEQDKIRQDMLDRERRNQRGY